MINYWGKKKNPFGILFVHHPQGKKEGGGMRTKGSNFD